MDNFISRRDLIEPEALSKLVTRSNAPGARQLAAHLLLIFITGFGVGATIGSVWIAALWMPYGILLAFLFSPLHECIHGTAFRSRHANLAVAAITGFLLLLPARYFRLFHFEHHRYTNDPQRDPELATPKPQTRANYLVSMSGIFSYWWPQIRSIAKHAYGQVEEGFITEREKSGIIAEARIHCLGYLLIACISLLTQSTVALTFWIVPLLIGMVALRCFLLAEHTACELTQDMLKNTRTTLTNPVVKFVSWNMPYHCEHHVFPAVPFHSLPVLSKHLIDRVNTVSDGYAQFHRGYVQSLQQVSKLPN